ncbi:MAG: PKD domain-containing protein, partial [Bifidobacteriaceae bacterium]|nr:PKD domain-containing protein [Bifidobacteriaceae bacterium]
MRELFRRQFSKSHNPAPAAGSMEPPVLVGRRRSARRLLQGGAVLAAAVVGLVSVILPAERSSADGTTLEAGFSSQASGGLVDVAWDRAGGSVVAASSVYSTASSYAAANALSAYSSYWYTANNQLTNQWIVIDLGAEWDVAQVRVTPYSTGYQPENVVLSVGSAPEGPFTQFADEAFGTGTAVRSYAAPAGTRGRYLRADFPALKTGASYMVLRRIEVLTGQTGGPEVSFNDVSEGPAQVTGWSWSFGDGGTSAEQNPTHTYAAPGTYQVSLTVTDANGGTATYQRQQVVRGSAVTPAVTVPATVNEGQSATFSVDTTGLASLRVDWGDGTSASTSAAASWSTLTAAYGVSHSFPDNGDFEVTVTGVDAYGLPTVPVVRQVTAANRAPTISGVSSTYEIFMPAQFNPSASVSDVTPDRAGLLCEWDYGDGTTANGTCTDVRTWQPHAYAPGTHTAVLTATDKDGAQAQASTTVTVKEDYYMNLYPVAGTARSDSVLMRVKVWYLPTYDEAAATKVEIVSGSTTVTVTTDEHGVAEARVPRVAGESVTATAVGQTGATGSDSNDLSMIGKPQGDIVFLVDDSGSMGSPIASVRNNIDFIADRLGAALDYQIGINPLPYTSAGPRILTPATDSLPWVHAAVAKLNANGSGEYGPDGIVRAFDSKMGLRPEAASCLVLVADEPTQWTSYTVADATQALVDNDATLFSIVTMTANAGNQEYRDMATGSGGAVFDIAAFVTDPQPLLDALTTQCVASVVERPDLSVTVDDGLAEVTQDGSGTHTVVVSNDGLVDAAGVELTLDVDGPVNLGAISDSGVATASAGGGSQVAWPAFGLAAGATASFTVGWSPSADAQPGDLVEVEANVADDGLNGADLSPANNTASDSTLVVATPVQTVSVVYVDDDAAGAPVVPVAGTRTVLVGNRLTPVGFTEAEARAGVPSGYVFASLDNVATFDDDDQVEQVITVHLAHHHTQSSLVVTRTVEYSGAGALTPAPVVQDLSWLVDADDVTGEVVYSAAAGYPEVVSPVVPGFYADPRTVPATSPVAATPVRPVDTVAR